MLRSQQLARPGARMGMGAHQPLPRLVSATGRTRLTIVAGDSFKNFFDKMKGGGGSGGAGKEDAARKAIQDSFNTKKFGQKSTPAPDPKKQAAGGDGGPGGGFGGFGGGGGGGGGGAPGAPDGEPGKERPILEELLELFKYSWTVFWNLALFLAFADMLHRSLDWCCQVELLLLVGAPQQAFERVAGRFFGLVEWFEKNVLGWDIPGEEDMIPQYENIKMFYPEAHAYTFDQYRYNLTDAEKRTLRHAYALRHYERDGGRPGDVDPADIKAIKARHEPLEADRKAYQEAKAEGRVEEYWQSRKDLYEKVVGKRFERPPSTA